MALNNSNAPGSKGYDKSSKAPDSEFQMDVTLSSKGPGNDIELSFIVVGTSSIKG